MSHLYETEYEIWADFGRLAVLKILDWAVKYATFEGNFFYDFMGIFFSLRTL